MSLAKAISSWSKDPSTKVGAVAIGDKGQVISQGYNGFPRRFDDSIEKYENRDTKYKYVVHAEMNCIYHATHNGLSLEGAKLYVYGLGVCHECAKGIVQVGIKEVYASCNPESELRWINSFALTKDILKKGGVNYEQVYH
jgi:dCMP deaminase